MCSRFTLTTPRSEIARRFGVSGHRALVGDIVPLYNVAPGTQITAVRADPEVEQNPDHPVHVDLSYWGYQPQWAREREDSSIPKPINARAETVATSRFFRDAFARRRCLIPANSWYEWDRDTTPRQPHYITRADGELLMFAGIWAPTGEGVNTCCAIITEPARGIAREVHARVPLMLDERCWRTWLDPQLTDREQVKEGTLRLNPARLTLWPVSRAVNDTRNRGAELIEPLSGLGEDT